MSITHYLLDLLSGTPGAAEFRGAVLAWSAEPLSQHIWEFVKVLVYIVAAWELLKHLYRWVFKRRSRLEQRLELAEEEGREKAKNINRLELENKRLTTDLEDARSRLPQAAIASADHEWRDSNTVLAIAQLERWFEANAESITTIALRLAKFHISRTVPDPGDHIGRAHDMLRLARGASPHNSEADELSSELDRMNAALQEQLIRDGNSQIAWNSAMMPPPGAQGEAMLPAVNALRGIADFCFDKGLWRLTPIFADRAADLALSGGGALRRVWFAVETTAANYQSMAGHATDGLQRIDYVLAEAQKTLPVRDQIAVNARFVRASALEELGRYDEALAEINAFAPIEVEVRGARHPATLSTRYRRASVLQNLGRYGKALAELDALALLRAEVLGPRHPKTLITRYLRAWVLENLGRYGEALAEFDAFAPIEVEVIGAHHPDAVNTRCRRASVLQDLGRYGEALAEFDALAPLQAELRGARHPYTLTTRYLRAGVLQDLGRYGEALAAYETTEPIYSETLGARHNFVLVGRRYHAICLANLERWDEALREIESVYAIEQERLAETVSTRSVQIGIEIAAKRNVDHADELRKIIDTLTAATGPSHQSTLRARYRLTRLLFQRRRVDEARAQIVDTIGHFDQMTDPGHSLLRSAKGLLEAIEGRTTSAALTV